MNKKLEIEPINLNELDSLKGGTDITYKGCAICNGKCSEGGCGITNGKCGKQEDDEDDDDEEDDDPNKES